jgi:hypothetical protein
MSYHRLPTAPLASRHRGAGGGAVDKRQPQGYTYIRPNSVQSNGATSADPVGKVNPDWGIPLCLELGPF